MSSSSFAKSGHWPTLLAAFLYFDASFMVWVILGPLAPFLSAQLHLSATQKGLLVAIPLLGGSVFRPILGILGDRLGGRRAGILGLSFTFFALLLGWQLAHVLWHFYVLGFLLGVAGASFAVALPLAGRWYPPEHQGLAMGIAGAGNSGTILATLFAPRLAQHFGVSATIGIAALPVMLVLLYFAVCARNSPTTPPPPAWKEYTVLLREPDTYWLCFLYSLTFGGFVGLTSFLTIFFADQYHLSKVRAGDFTTLVVVAGSCLRPVGGWVADKIGGYRLLIILLFLAGALLGAVGTIPPLFWASCFLFMTMGALGMGNGAIFQLVPQRFSAEIGVITGLVGAAGGLGGFFLPFGLGVIKDRTGQYGVGLLLFAGVFLVGCAVLLELGRYWRSSWTPPAVLRAQIFSYRNRARTVRPAIGEAFEDAAAE